MTQKSELELGPEEMRRLGYRVVDMLVRHFESLREKPVTRGEARRSLAPLFSEPLPESGSVPFEVLDFLEREVLTRIMHLP
jgi:hypothetical protein